MTASSILSNTDDDLIENCSNHSKRAALSKSVVNNPCSKDARRTAYAKTYLRSHSSPRVNIPRSIPWCIVQISFATVIEVIAKLLATMLAKYSISMGTKCNSKKANKLPPSVPPPCTISGSSTNHQSDFVFFTAAFAASVAAVGGTPFSLNSQDNSSFNYYDVGGGDAGGGEEMSNVLEKDTIGHRSILPSVLNGNETTAVNAINATNTTTTAAIAAEDWAHFYDLMLSWQGICLITVFCTFIVITIIGNTLVILAVITTRRLKTVTNCFVMSLAVADLLVGIFVMPPAVAVHLIGSWQLGWILCDIWISLDVLLCTASILSLCAISVDRYLAVTQPLNYSRKRRSKRLALIMILVVWVLALAITCPPMLGWYEPGRRDLEECRYNQNEGYVIFSAMGSFFIPMAVMIYVYTRISCVIASRHDNMTDISVHNKKFKRYTSADVENDMDHYLSEQELNATQKKQMAVRTFSNQTIVKELHEVMLSDSGENGSTRATHCLSLLTLPTGNAKNSCYELTRPSSFRRSPTPSATMTSGCGGTMGSTGVSSLGGDSENARMTELHWSYGGGSAGGSGGGGNGSCVAHTRTQSMRQHHQLQQQQQSHQPHEQHLLSTSSTAGIGISVTSPQNHNQQQQQQHQRDTRLIRVYQHPQQQQHHHHAKSLSNRITSLKKENKTTQTLSIVVGGFIACWLPFFVYYLITPFLDEHQVSRTLTNVLTWLGWFNSAINPFIYAFYSVDFRAAFWRLTCKRFFSSSSKPPFPSNTMSIRR